MLQQIFIEWKKKTTECITIHGGFDYDFGVNIWCSIITKKKILLNEQVCHKFRNTPTILDKIKIKYN